MKVSVEKLRWSLAGAVVLLVVGLLALVSYGRWAAAKKWKDILARNGIHVTQESDNVTWSQTVQGRTVFTIRARKVFPISNGKYTLHGVTLLLYGKNANSVDRVEGDEFEYDEKEGVAKAIGEVHMDIQAPGALRRQPAGSAASSGGSPTPDAPLGSESVNDKDVIHVLTSGLVYLRKLGVAATDQRVEFRYAGMTCVSKGAEFNTGDSVLHLLADVELTGALHGQPVVVRAVRADLDRDNNTITALQPVATTTMRSGSETGRAKNALLLLRPDGSLQHAYATGGVLLESAGRRVGAQRLVAAFAAQNIPESAVLSAGVTLEGSAAKPMHGAAAEADLAFTPAGVVKNIVAKGAVRLTASVRRPGMPVLAREMRGEQVTASFRADRNGKEPVLQEVHAVGGAAARSEAFATVKPGARTAAGLAASGVVSTEVSADELLAAFAPGSASGRPSAKAGEAELQHLGGRGHTRLQQSGLNGAEQVSTGDSLEAVFVPGTGAGLTPGGGVRLQSAVQAGHVEIRDRTAATGTPAGSVRLGTLSLAHGDRAAFDGAASRLTLTGGAGYQQEGTSVSAASLVLEQGGANPDAKGNAEAQGNVEVTLAAAGREATHVLADRAKLSRSAGTAEFFGTDAHPARLWQAGSQVLAANLFLENGPKSLLARPGAAGGKVEAVFASQGRAGGVRKAEAAAGKTQPTREGAGEAVHVTSAALTYSGQRHEAVCSGGVRLRQGETEARAQQAVVFLSGSQPGGKGEAVQGTAAGAAGLDGLGGEMGGTLERLVLSGNVRLDRPGGAGDGEQLVYTAKEGTYLLTGTAGKPPRVADAEQGMVTGPALLFRSGEKSVIVTGASASNGHGGGRGNDGRVHTEVAVRPQEK